MVIPKLGIFLIPSLATNDDSPRQMYTTGSNELTWFDITTCAVSMSGFICVLISLILTQPKTNSSRRLCTALTKCSAFLRTTCIGLDTSRSFVSNSIKTFYMKISSILNATLTGRTTGARSSETPQYRKYDIPFCGIIWANGCRGRYYPLILLLAWYGACYCTLSGISAHHHSKRCLVSSSTFLTGKASCCISYHLRRKPTKLRPRLYPTYVISSTARSSNLTKRTSCKALRRTNTNATYFRR